MDVVAQRAHPVREALRVRDDAAVRGPIHLPAVVDDDVLVAGALHAGGDDGVGHLAYQ